MKMWEQQIRDYKPYNGQEEKDKALIVGCMDT